MLERASALLLCTVLVAGTPRAANDPFVGRWKLVKASDEMKVTSVGANTYAFDFGGGADAVETIVVDGTDQPGAAGTTLSVAAHGPNWKVVRKKGGQTLITANWTLSKDGSTLHDNFTLLGPNGSKSTVDYVYTRRVPGKGSGFAGTWVSTIAAVAGDVTLDIRPYQSDGLSFITRTQSQYDTTNVSLDGKDHPGASAGSASSGRRLNARAIDIVRTSNGKITQTRQMHLSPDLKTLTLTVSVAGEDDPKTYIFERQ